MGDWRKRMFTRTRIAPALTWGCVTLARATGKVPVVAASCPQGKGPRWGKQSSRQRPRFLGVPRIQLRTTVALSRPWPLVQPAASHGHFDLRLGPVTTYSLTFHRLTRGDLERLLPRFVEWLDRPDVDVEIRLVDNEDESYTPDR